MPYIKESFIETIRERADIADVIGSFIKLKKKGSRLFAISPFTDEKTPSFCVFTDTQRFKDFSSGRSGDVITFLMEHQHLTYPEAVEWLAKKYGYDVEYENAEWAKEKEKKALHKESLRPYMLAALRRYQQELFALPEDHPAKHELVHRGYTEEDIAEWEIGYAPGGKLIFNELKKINKLKEGKELFLVGDKADKYWNRLIYPIHDANGLVVGLAGRDLTGEKKVAKWLNPADTPLYKKDKIWYALHKAKAAIRQRDEAWVVEGYNDVIAWHKYGIANTVASCGTAISDRQIRMLKRYTTRVLLCMDGDEAGRAAMVKRVPAFLAAGFTVECLLLPEGDPDDFCRQHRKALESGEFELEPYLVAEYGKINGFKLLIDHYISGTETARASGAKKMAEMVAMVQDDGEVEIYLGWIAKESGLKRSLIDKWYKDAVGKRQEERSLNARFLLPHSVKEDINNLKDDIEKYGMFIANNRIWMLTGNEPPFTFKEVSNFTIEIIQHMHDEKLPMKLVRIRNIYGDERIFDVPSENLNTPLAFDNAVTNHGNFLWTGGRNEFQRLRSYLFDRMGVGYKIEVLGWQPEKFWVWNNGITIPGKGTKPIDENGIYKTENASYYIPSANHIYANNNFKYTPQKKVVILESPVTFTAYTAKMIEVHRQHAITGILFTMASMFLDIIEDKLGNFPLLFLYGPASSGKDQLIECCQSFFGRPQSPIHIGNKVSTSKAQVRKFAQFRNMIVHLSEYRPGDQQLDELLKGFWDRRGYERGTIDSAYGTETVPVHSSVIFTGNHYPEDDALITRFICEEMTKNDFSAAEKKRYRELQDMNKDGISSLTTAMLNARSVWEEKFKETFRKVENTLKGEFALIASHDRMISNMAVLGAAYELMKDFVQFPFSWNDFVAHQRISLERQVRKLNTASVYMKWWDCFLAAVRTKQDPIKHGKEFRIYDNRLMLNFTHCYNRVSQQWWAQYHEVAPSKSKVSDMLLKHESFIEKKDSVRMDGTRSGARTSAWILNLGLVDVNKELLEAVSWQIKEGTDMPTLPGENNTNDNPLSPQMEVPF